MRAKAVLGFTFSWKCLVVSEKSFTFAALNFADTVNLYPETNLIQMGSLGRVQVHRVRN